MSTTTIKLYKDAVMRPEFNYSVDNVADYLATLTADTLYNFQYVRPTLNQVIKIDADQEEAIKGAYNYNYLSITYETGAVYYYFVTRKEQTAAETVRLTLLLDVLNTFKPGTDYDFNAKTEIMREHKPRFKSVSMPALSVVVPFIFGAIAHGTGVYYGSFTIQADELIGRTLTESAFTLASGFSFRSFEWDKETGTASGTMFAGSAGTFSTYAEISAPAETFTARNIDRVSEEVSPALYGEDAGRVLPGQPSFYLVYGSTDEQAQAGTYKVSLYADNELTAEYEETPSTIDASSLTTGEYYYFYINNNTDYVYLTDDNGYSYKVYAEKGTAIGRFSYWYYIRLTRSGNNISVTEITREKNDIGIIYVRTRTKSVSSLKVSFNTPQATRYTLAAAVTDPAVIVAGTTYVYTTTETDATLLSIDSVDRYASSISRIIKIPYAPEGVEYYENGGVYISSAVWAHDTTNGFYIRKAFNPTARDYEITDLNPLAPLFPTISPALAQTRNDANESKLFNSSFYSPRFVYDSFVFPFSLELVEPSAPVYAFHFNYFVTSNLTGKFLFTFTDYTTGGNRTTDYDNVLIASRNNEVALYNSSYIDYLRNGYNYDVKNKQRNDIMNVVNTGLGVAGAVAGAVAGGPVGFSLAAGIAGRVISSVNTAVSENTAFAQKQQQMKAQAGSVAGADDIDLLTAYSGNKAKLIIYTPDERTTKALKDMFYYTGYAVNNLGIPNYASRVYFNYVMANPLFDSLNNLTDEVVQELTICYQSGVTFFHKVGGTWNFAQSLENWETDLI